VLSECIIWGKYMSTKLPSIPLLRNVSRRLFLSSSARFGASAATALMLSSCAASSGNRISSNPVSGTLRLGMAGGSTTDSFDVRTYTDSVAIALGYQVMNGFIEIDANRKAVPELFESWEVKPGAAEWHFKLRRGVVFHNGKSLTVADAIYSLNLHRGASTSPMKQALSNIADVKSEGTDGIVITLSEGDADFLYVLSDYHLLVVPDGFTDWSHPIGTGAFKFEMYEPGVRASTTRQANYWKPGAGNVQAVETWVMNNDSSRLEALRTNQVDVINRVPWSSGAAIENDSSLLLVRQPSGYHLDFAMNVEASPFDNPNLRLALKYAIDRDEFVKELVSGYGRVGNDHPIPSCDPFYNSELTQRSYDPDKAAFHLKKSGLSDTEISLAAANAAYRGAVDRSEAFARSASRAGIKMKVEHVAENSFWDSTWMHAPFFTSYWGGRPAATQMLSVAYKSTASWNETHWRVQNFDALLRSARTEVDESKRRSYIWEMQAMLNQQGGAIIPAFSDSLDVHRQRVQNLTPHMLFDFCNGRIAEKVSLTS
jgi:peptide/nickel transport system substrate-binding protein